MFTAGDGLKKVKKNARDHKMVIRFNKSSSAKSFWTNYEYDEFYGKPAYAVLIHFKPGSSLEYPDCSDDPKRPGEARDYTLCTLSCISSVCVGK